MLCDACSFTIVIPGPGLLFMQGICLEYSTYFFLEIYQTPTETWLISRKVTQLSCHPGSPIWQNSPSEPKIYS